jgi:hypothetical protein
VCVRARAVVIRTSSNRSPGVARVASLGDFLVGGRGFFGGGVGEGGGGRGEVEQGGGGGEGSGEGVGARGRGGGQVVMEMKVSHEHRCMVSVIRNTLGTH